MLLDGRLGVQTAVWASRRSFAARSTKNDNNGVEQQQGLQQQGPLGICFGCILWEYGADICSRTSKSCVLYFLVFDNFCVLCSWPAAVVVLLLLLVLCFLVFDNFSVLCFWVFDNFSVLCSWPAVRSTTNHNNGVEQQQGLQQQGLWEYVSDLYSGNMERTYAPRQGNVVF